MTWLLLLAFLDLGVSLRGQVSVLRSHLLDAGAPCTLSFETAVFIIIHCIRVSLQGGVDDGVRHNVSILSEHPNLHLLWLISFDWCDQRAHFATVDGIATEGEAKLMGQVARHRLEVVFDDES